jgi:uncharacterized protein DUF1566
MKKMMLKFPVYLVLFSLTVLCLIPNSAMAEGDGGWTTTTSPGYIFQIEEDLFNNQKHLAMTVIKPDLDGTEVYWGPASGSDSSTYLLNPLLHAGSDMIATWQFNSPTQATVTVESCTTNCFWQSGQVVTLNKIFGDQKSMGSATRVPKTGQTECWDTNGDAINCTGTGQDGEYQLGVLPAVTPSEENPYTVYGWTGIRFTDNLDGTVTDNLTGLIWLKNANCLEGSWTEALSACSNLASGTCGLRDGSAAGDWRLPNINELRSLIDPTRSSPALPVGYPFTGLQGNGFYWSSTTLVSDLEEQFAAYFIIMNTGEVTRASKGGFQLFIWPVRSGS